MAEIRGQVQAVLADGLVFTEGADGVVNHIGATNSTHKIQIDNDLIASQDFQLGADMKDINDDLILQQDYINDKIKFHKDIDFNNVAITNIANSIAGQLNPTNLASNDGFDNLELELNARHTLASGAYARTNIGSSASNKNAIYSANGNLGAGQYEETMFLRNNETNQQSVVGDLNLATGKRIKYDGVAIEISSADKLDKDFGNVGANILPEANTHSDIARTTALTNGLALKANLSGATFTGDVRLNNLTASKVLVLDGDKDITTSDDLLMTTAERNKINNVPTDTNTSLSNKASLNGATFTGDVRLDNLTASKVLVLDGDKDITTDDGLLMTTAERNKITNVPTDTNTSLSTKANLNGATFTGNINLSNLTPSKRLIIGSAGNIETSNDLLMNQAERDKITNVPTNTNTSLATKATLSSDNTFTGNITINTNAITADKPLMVDGNKQIKTSTNSFITSAQSTAISDNSTNITTITNNYVHKDGSVDFTGNILAPTIEVGTTGYTITKDGNNDLTMNIPTGEIYNFKINNSLIAKIDSGGVDLGSGKTYAIDGTDLITTATNNTFTGNNTFNGNTTFAGTNDVVLNEDAEIICATIFNGGAVVGTDVEYCAKRKCSFRELDETLSGIKTFSNNVILSNLTASKSLVLDSNNIISTSNDLLMTSAEQSKLTNLASDANSTYAPKANPSFTGDAIFAGDITVGNGSNGIFFGSDDKPKITAFDNNLIIQTNDASKFINFKTTQGAGGGTIDSFKLNDTYAEIDDGYGLRIGNCDVSKFVKTDGDRKLVSGTIGLSDLPSNVLINNVDGALGTSQFVLGTEFLFSGGPSNSFALNIVADTDGAVGTQEPSIHLQNNVGANDGYVRLTGSTETLEIESNKHVLTKCGTDASHTIKLAHGSSTKITVGTSSVVFAEDTVQSALKDYKKNGVSYGVFEMLANLQPTAWELISDNGSFATGFQSHSTFGATHSLGASSMRYQVYNVGGTAVKHIFLSGAIRKTDTSAITDETALFTFDAGFRVGRDKYFTTAGSGGDFGCIVKIKTDGVLSMFKRQEHDNPPASGNLQYVILDGIHFFTDET